MKPMFKLTMFTASLAMSGQALAANCIWNPATGNWSTASDWSCGIVPSGPGIDTANIGAGKVVTVNDTRSISTLINAGQINIDQQLFTLQGATTNSGIINVGSAITAALQVQGGNNIDNTGGTMNVANSSVINQFSSTIKGGTINTAGTRKLVAFTSISNFLDGVTLNGTLDLTGGNAFERVINGLTLNGAVNVASGGVLALGLSQTINGAGTINLNDSAALLALDGDGTTTLASTITVRGQGRIGNFFVAGNTNNLVNNGRISADVGGASLTINPGANLGNLTNNGTLEAKSGGQLILSTNVIANAAGQFVIGTGSSVLQRGVTISGTVNASGAGSFNASTSISNFLDGVTFNGTLNLTSGNAFERVINGLTLNGVVNVASGGVLALGLSQTINGAGTINLNDSAALLALDGDGTTTLASTITVRGQGRIGNFFVAGNTNNLVNSGRISADVGGATLTRLSPLEPRTVVMSLILVVATV